MILKKKFDLINVDNIVALNRADILKNSISSEDLKLLLDKVNTVFKIVNNDILKLFYYIFNKNLQNNFKNGRFISDDIVFVNIENLELPAYYNQIDKNFVCNFLKPVYYLSVYDIIAHILYAYVYKYQFKLSNISSKLVKYIGDIFSTIFLFNFGNKEGLLSDLKSLFYLRLITYKYVYKFIFNKDYKLISLFNLIDVKLKNLVDINETEIKNIEKIIDVSNISKYLTSLSKLDLSPNVDAKTFVSVLYRKYNINPVIMFESVDRILPYLITLNFNNIINNNFSVLIKDELLINFNNYSLFILKNKL